MNNEINNEVKPYPGLRCFQYKENYLFFGREGKAQEIASRLQDSHFLAVVGTSGSGKSSLVRAGLLPLLYGGMLYEFGSHWRIALMRPEETPIHNLAEALTYPVDFETEENGNQPKDENQIAIAEATLRRSGVGLLDFLNNPANSFDEDENLLIVVDQFEELFRFKEKSALEDTEEAAAFVKLLLEATRDKSGRIFVVITMRSDFLGDCAEFRDLPEAINDGQYLIPRMTRDQLRQSIESPAFVGDAQVSPALVNRLLNDLEDQNQALDVRDRIVKDHLPVLAHALMRTWDLWKKRGELTKPIDVEHYDNEEIGGMAHALSIHADEAYNDLSESQKLIAKKMFRCLTETDSENRETRRPAKIEEICAVTGASEKVVCEIIEIFRQESKGRTFLMPPEDVELTKETKVDISHESLIRNWEILKGWVREEAKDAWIYRRISEAALLLRQYEDEMKGELESEEFERNCRDFLWRGIELKAALKWRDTFGPNVNWASRYQPLTETEKLELRELSRTAPKSEPAKRWEFIQLHFDKVGQFLTRSAEHEAIEQAKEERIQQERMLAAEQLAEVEREKADGLRDLTDSLKRQRRILFVVFGFSLVLMLTASILAVYALQSRTTAQAAQARAEEEKTRADEEKEKAKAQEKLAQDAEADAKKQKETADEKKLEALDEKKKADIEKENAKKQEEIANKKKQEALDQKKIADGEKEKAKTQEGIALAAKGELEKSLIEKEKINEQSKLNIEGLTAFENYDYEGAKKNFVDLEKTYDASDKGNIWWARYNVAKSYEQQGDFEGAKNAYQNALNTLPSYTPATTANINIQKFSGVNFINASYKPNQPADDTLLKENRIITLRKFAQFYRNCAAKPDDCFDGYTLNQSAAKNEYSDLNETDPRYLNNQALGLYLELLEIKEQKSGGNNLNLPEKDRIFLADVQTELADTYFDLYLPELAEKNYNAALDVYGTFGGKRTLTEISLRKRLLETKLRNRKPKIDEADIEAATIISKKTAFLLDLYSKANRTERLTEEDIEKKIAVDKSLGVIYGELGDVYRRYSELALKDFIGYLEYEKDRLNDKNPSTRAIQSDPKAAQKNSNDASNDDTQNKVNFLAELRNLIYQPSESAPPNMTTAWHKNVWKRVSFYYDIYKRLNKKSDLFLNIARPIEILNNKENRSDPDKLVSAYMSLAGAYVRMGEVEKSDARMYEFRKSDLVVAAGFAYVESQFSDEKEKSKYFQNKVKYAEIRLGMLRDMAIIYEISKDYCKAAALSSQWAQEFEKQFPDQSNFNVGIENASFYRTAGEYYFLCGDCPGSLPKAREMYSQYLNYIEKNEANIKESGDTNWFDKNNATIEKIELRLLIGQTYESEKNVGELINTYEELIGKIEIWRKKNQISVPNQNRANANVSNTNLPGPTPSGRPVDANAMPINPGAFKVEWENIFSFYESYLRVHLAELYFNQDPNKAGKLPVKFTENFAPPKGEVVPIASTAITLKYAVSAKNIGDSFKQNDGKQAERYYQSAIKVFETAFEEGYFYSEDISVREYFASYVLSKKFFTDYLSALKSLRELKGVDLELDKKIATAEENLDKAPAVPTAEKAKCLSAP